MDHGEGAATVTEQHFPRGFAFRLVNVASKFSLHGGNPHTSPGNVVQYSPHDWATQRWTFIRVSADNSVYMLGNLDSGYMLHGDNLPSGGNVRQYPLWPNRDEKNRDSLNPCQMWRVTPAGSDTYTLENLDSRAMLTGDPIVGVEGNARQAAAGAGLSQRWTITADGPLLGGDGLPWGTQDDIYIAGMKPKFWRLPVGIGVDFDERMVPNANSSSIFTLPPLPQAKCPVRDSTATDMPGYWEYYRAGTDGVSGPVLDSDKRILFRAGVVHDIMYSSRMPTGLYGEPWGSAPSRTNLAHTVWKMYADKVMFLNSLCLLARAYGESRFGDALVVANRVFDALNLTPPAWDAYVTGQKFAISKSRTAPPLTLDEFYSLIHFVDNSGFEQRGSKLKHSDWDWNKLTGIQGGFMNRRLAIVPRLTSVNGYNLSEAVHAAGRFVQVGTHEWHELDAKGAITFTFMERTRDEWSVYLTDPNRNCFIQLDAFRKKVRYNSASSQPTDLYTIQEMHGGA